MFSTPHAAGPPALKPLLWSFAAASLLAAGLAALRSGIAVVVFAAAATAALAAYAVAAIRPPVERRAVLTGVVALGLALIVERHPDLAAAGVGRERTVAVLLLAAVVAFGVVLRRLPTGPAPRRLRVLVAAGAVLPLVLPVWWLADRSWSGRPGEAASLLGTALPGLLGTGLAVAAAIASVRRADRRLWLVAGALLLEGLVLTQMMDLVSAWSIAYVEELHRSAKVTVFLQPGLAYGRLDAFPEPSLLDLLDTDTGLAVAAGLAAPALIAVGVARARTR